MKKLLFYIIIALVASISFARQHEQDPAQTPPTRKIYLLHANTLSFDKTVDDDRQVLRGNVKFRQDSVYMYCDSAYFYERKNAMEAFSNVRMVQGDTLEIECDSMSYYGNMMMAQFFDNVKLTHNSTVLTTEYMTYERDIEVAHYPYKGTIVDPDNHLESMMGWYLAKTKEAIFRGDVVLRSYDFSKMEKRPKYPDPYSEEYSPRAILYSDTLLYSFNISEASIVGPSRIETDTATVYSSSGFYNTASQQCRLYNRSYIVSPGRYAIADSLFYDSNNGIGDGWGDIVMVDSLQSMKLTGEYMHYIDDPQSVMVTGKALAIEYSDKDTLYLHADTLRAFTIINPDSMLVSVGDTIATTAYRYDTIFFELDSAKIDSIIPDSFRVDSIPFDTVRIDSREVMTHYIDTLRFMTAHYGVRYFREDMQGVCDSLHYSVKDSLATFVGDPVMWNTSYQITGDTIYAFIDETKSIKRAEIHNQAFLVQEKDTFTMHEIGPRNKITNTETRAYDQIKGKDLVCLFDSAKIKQMDMSGNVQVIYFPVESDGGMTGLNQVIGSYMSVWFENQQMEKLKIWPNPVGSLTPIQLVQPDILTLEGFRWMDYLRPKDPMDVFRKIKMSEEDKVENVSLFNSDELNGY